MTFGSVAHSRDGRLRITYHFEPNIDVSKSDNLSTPMIPICASRMALAGVWPRPPDDEWTRHVRQGNILKRPLVRDSNKVAGSQNAAIQAVKTQRSLDSAWKKVR